MTTKVPGVIVCGLDAARGLVRVKPRGEVKKARNRVVASRLLDLKGAKCPFTAEFQNAALKIYSESDYFNLKCIISDVDGKKYCVRERKNINLNPYASLNSGLFSAIGDFIGF